MTQKPTQINLDKDLLETDGPVYPAHTLAALATSSMEQQVCRCFDVRNEGGLEIQTHIGGVGGVEVPLPPVTWGSWTNEFGETQRWRLVVRTVFSTDGPVKYAGAKATGFDFTGFESTLVNPILTDQTIQWQEESDFINPSGPNVVDTEGGTVVFQTGLPIPSAVMSVIHSRQQEALAGGSLSLPTVRQQFRSTLTEPIVLPFATPAVGNSFQTAAYIRPKSSNFQRRLSVDGQIIESEFPWDWRLVDVSVDGQAVKGRKSFRGYHAEVFNYPANDIGGSPVNWRPESSPTIGSDLDDERTAFPKWFFVEADQIEIEKEDGNVTNARWRTLVTPRFPDEIHELWNSVEDNPVVWRENFPVRLWPTSTAIIESISARWERVND